MPVSLASVCTTNCASKKGRASTGAEAIRALTFSEASCCAAPYSYLRSFFVKDVSGSTIVAKSARNFLYQEAFLREISPWPVV